MGRKRGLAAAEDMEDGNRQELTGKDVCLSEEETKGRVLRITSLFQMRSVVVPRLHMGG